MIAKLLIICVGSMCIVVPVGGFPLYLIIAQLVRRSRMTEAERLQEDYNNWSGT